MAAIALAIGAGVAGVAGMAGSIIGANANADAMDKASAIQAAQYAETKKALEQGKTEAQGFIKPYADVGGNALNELAYGMGLNTPTEGYTSANTQKGGFANYGADQYQRDVGYTPMVNSLAELQATPGYQFQLEQGLQGVNNSAAAKGGLLSGANLKAINNYAQGQAATGYQSAWERAQGAYQNAFGRNQQKFSNLQSLANNGQTAATNQGQASLSVGSGLAGASTAYGNNQGNLAMAQGQNQANMYTGIGNAVGGMASSLSGLYAGSGGFGGSGGGGGGNAANLSGLSSGNSPSSMVNWNNNPSLGY